MVSRFRSTGETFVFVRLAHRIFLLPVAILDSLFRGPIVVEEIEEGYQSLPDLSWK